MNGYLCFYGSKQVEVHAESSYAAQCEAANQLKVPKGKRYLISAHLCEKDGQQVTHTPDF